MSKFLCTASGFSRGNQIIKFCLALQHRKDKIFGKR